MTLTVHFLTPKCIGIVPSTSCTYVWNMKVVRWKLLRLSCQNQSVEKVQMRPWHFDPKMYHMSHGTMKLFRKLPSPYSSLLSTRYFEIGRSNKVRHWLRVSFFKRTILLLIHYQVLQFWYQCIKKTSIYHIIDNFPQNCHRNTRKTDKDYDFPQSAKLTCVGDLWTQKMENPFCTAIYQMTSANDFESRLRAVIG